MFCGNKIFTVWSLFSLSLLSLFFLWGPWLLIRSIGYFVHFRIFGYFLMRWVWYCIADSFCAETWDVLSNSLCRLWFYYLQCAEYDSAFSFASFLKLGMFCPILYVVFGSIFNAPSMIVHYRLPRFRNLGCLVQIFMSSLVFTREKKMYDLVLENLIAVFGRINLGEFWLWEKK